MKKHGIKWILRRTIVYRTAGELKQASRRFAYTGNENFKQLKLFAALHIFCNPEYTSINFGVRYTFSVVGSLQYGMHT